MSQFNFYFWTVLPGISCLLCFGAALAIAGIVVRNKGAKFNLTWALFALALVSFGAAEGDMVLAQMSLPNVLPWESVMRAAGALLALIGALYGRRLFKELLK